MFIPKTQYTSFIKQEAKRLGFDFCGISKAGFLEEEAPRLENWLNNQMNGEMHYMENYFDKRLDPRLLVEGSESVISLLLNYYPQEQQTDPAAPRISKYAYGKDYHLVIKEKCHAFIQSLRENIGDINGRCFVDSAPVMDKVWAKKAGLGWIGKHSNLISKQHGSYFFIAEIILDVKLAYDAETKDYCGTCTRCIDACPTQAITSPYVVDGSKCISYFTIELKNNIPETYKNKLSDWVFGCDICQDVCPWNRFSQQHQEPLFKPSSDMLSWDRKAWMEISEEVFRKTFKDSAVKRAGYRGLKRNLNALSSGELQ